MADHIEEQEMEAEALAAIFDTAFEVISPTPPMQWNVKLRPVDCEGDEEADEAENHVAVMLNVTVPESYPEVLPELDITVLKGLAETQRRAILKKAEEEAENYMGMPAIYAVCEVIREWLIDNNVKGLDDESMHAQMMRRANEAKRSEEKAKVQFEAQTIAEEMTEAEKEEIEVRKRRAEGTPCNEENFLIWKQKFDAEMAEKEKLKDGADSLKEKSSKKKGNKNAVTEEEKMEGRLTGFEIFSNKGSGLDALEKAAEDAAATESNLDVEDFDEGLFHEDSDEDLDSLDFDSDDDSDDEEIDI